MKILFFILIFLNFKTTLTTRQNEEQPTIIDSSTITEIANSNNHEENFDDIFMEWTSADLELIFNFINGNDNEQQSGHGQEQLAANKDVPSNNDASRLIRNLIPDQRTLLPKITEKNELFEKRLQEVNNASKAPDFDIDKSKSAAIEQIESMKTKKRKSIAAGKRKIVAAEPKLLHGNKESARKMRNKEMRKRLEKLTGILNRIHILQEKLAHRKHLDGKDRSKLEKLIIQRDKLEQEIKEHENCNEQSENAQDVQAQQANPANEVPIVDLTTESESDQDVQEQRVNPAPEISKVDSNKQNKNDQYRQEQEANITSAVVDVHSNKQGERVQHLQKQQAVPAPKIIKVHSTNFNEIMEKFQQKHSLPSRTSATIKNAESIYQNVIEAQLTESGKRKGKQKLSKPISPNPIPIHSKIAQQTIPVPVQNSYIEANSPNTNEFADELEQMLEKNTQGRQSMANQIEVSYTEHLLDEIFDETYAQIQFNIGEMENDLKAFRDSLESQRNQVIPMMDELLEKHNQIAKLHNEEPSKKDELEVLKQEYKEMSANLTQLLENIKLDEAHIGYIEIRLREEKESLKHNEGNIL